MPKYGKLILQFFNEVIDFLNNPTSLQTKFAAFTYPVEGQFLRVRERMWQSLKLRARTRKTCNIKKVRTDSQTSKTLIKKTFKMMSSDLEDIKL